MDSQEINERLNHLRHLKRVAKTKADEASSAKSEMEEYQHQLFQDMRASNLYSAKTDQGQFSLKSTIYPTIQNREEFIAWCHEHGMDDYVQEVEAKGRLGEMVRQRLDDGEELPPGVHYYVKEYISVKEGN